MVSRERVKEGTDSLSDFAFAFSVVRVLARNLNIWNVPDFLSLAPCVPILQLSLRVFFF